MRVCGKCAGTRCLAAMSWMVLVAVFGTVLSVRAADQAKAGLKFLRAVLAPAILVLPLLMACDGKDGSGRPAKEQIQAPIAATASQAATPPVSSVNPPASSLKLERVFEPVTFAEPKTDSDWEPYAVQIDSFKIESIAEGKYKGGDLLLVRVWHYGGGPCKGETCERPDYQHLRYVRFGKQMIFLPRISRAAVGYRAPNKPSFLGKNPFEKFGFALATDPDFTIAQYEYPEKIAGASPRQVLKLSDEEEGELDTRKLVKVMDPGVFGGVYTTRPELSPANRIYTEADSNGPTPGSCYGATCFSTNAFFVFRPDGTLLKYFYEPSSSAEYSSYKFHTTVGCSGTALDHLAVVDPALIKDTDLTPVDKTQQEIRSMR